MDTEWTMHWFRLAALLEKLVWKQKDFKFACLCIQMLEAVHIPSTAQKFPASKAFAFGFNRVNNRLS